MKVSGEIKEKAELLLERLTLEEKITMLHGEGLFHTGEVKRLGLPCLRMSDGPMGVRAEWQDAAWVLVGHSQDACSYLPSNSAVAATWSRQRAYEVGSVLGEEARGRGKDVILAPGINIKRSPLNGRSFEYMSEDPYLTAEQCVPLIQGIQQWDVAACVKHFALNSQETQRLWVDVEVEERALREIYLPAFRAAVDRGNSYSLMGAYNLVRGQHCCESKLLLNRILRKEWGYEGAVVSDWGGVHRTREAAESGLDIEMSVTDNFDQYCMAQPLQKAVEAGEIPQALIDEKIRHILWLMMQLHMFDVDKATGQVVESVRKSGSYNTPAHRERALAAARESIVLLKNEGNRLPLKKEKLKRLLLIGDNGDRIHSNGGGSAEIKALYEITPYMGLAGLLGGNCEITYIPGYYVEDSPESRDNWQETSLEDRESSQEEVSESQGCWKEVVPESQGCWQEARPENQENRQKPQEASQEAINAETAQKRKELLEEAVRHAAEYEQVIFIGGLNHQQDLEGQDRQDMKLPYGQNEVLEAVLEVNPNTVVVMVAGSPVEMSSWEKKAKAILWSFYGGMEGGSALAEVLLGMVNPSGKLPETLPYSHLDCSAHCVGDFAEKELLHYREGIYVGYRYYEKNQVPVQYCFGHGLSYTTFDYRNMAVQKRESAGTLEVEVNCDICNTGERAGKEAVQLYIRDCHGSGDRPVKELKGYEKLELAPGETGRVTFWLDRASFAVYEEQAAAFTARPGRYEIILASSLLEERLRADIIL